MRDLAVALGDADIDEHGRLVVAASPRPTFAVTPAHHRRALLLVDGLAKTLVGRGHEVSFRPVGVNGARHAQLLVSAGGSAIALSMEEVLDRTKHEPTAGEAERSALGYSYGIPKYDRAPTGKLRLTVDAHASRASWADSATRRLEDSLGAAVLVIESEAERRRALALEEAHRRQEAEAELLRRDGEARRARAREAHARHIRALEADLRQMADEWAAASRVRDFIAAVDRATPAALRGEVFNAWIAWAREHAQHLDPLTEPGRIAKMPMAEAEAERRRIESGPATTVKRPFVATFDQVKITRDGDVAVIEYADDSVATTRLSVGAEKLAAMTDEEVLDFWNDLLVSREAHRDTLSYTATEIPVGKPQVEFHPDSNQWTPRGHVVRCQVLSDAAVEPNLDEAFVSIDGRDFTLVEFMTLVGPFGGWGMRIEFVPDDELHKRPKIRVRDPDAGKPRSAFRRRRA